MRTPKGIQSVTTPLILITLMLLAAVPYVGAHPNHLDDLIILEEDLKVQYVGKMSLSPQNGVAGTEVTVTGEGLPASSRLDLMWYTVDGEWNVIGPEYHGRTFQRAAWPLGPVTTDASGTLEAAFLVPEDYGFGHDVVLVQDGVIRNKVLFNLDTEVVVSPTSGPPGTPITIDIKGVGWQSMENSWTVLYDNKFTGWMSSVTTRGHARAVIPAAGGSGEHVIRVLTGAFQVPYLNNQQSPVSYLPEFVRSFTITEGEAVLPPPPSEQSLPPQAAALPRELDDPLIYTDPASGTVGMPINLHGQGFPPGADVELRWYRVTGNRVSGQGWEESSVVLGTASVDEGGTLRFSFEALDDLGGPHRIAAGVGDAVVAETEFLITPSAAVLTPASGPVGTVAEINLKGVGWTETANIYHVVYDNAYIGYACGFNSQGNVTIYLPVTGEPGWHFIDLYPGIYKGKEVRGVDNFRIPQLTYAEDHPGEELPGFRFAFQITE